MGSNSCDGKPGEAHKTVHNQCGDCIVIGGSEKKGGETSAPASGSTKPSWGTNI